MNDLLVEVEGKLWGRRRSNSSGDIAAEVVQVHREGRPVGPAENALLYIEVAIDGRRSARYISWINFYDLEYARRKQTGWELVEPPAPYQETVIWMAYGWGGTALPSVAETSPPSG